MDSPDLELVFKNYQSQHKHNPITVIGELAQKRRDVTQQNRKSHRLTQFDYGRQLPPAQHSEQTPEKLTEIQIKAQQRRLHLEKWKEEKEKQKKIMLLNKKKPFLSAVAPKASIPIVPPPIPSKAGPSANRRVTRSQANKNKEKEKKNVEMATQFDLPKIVSFTGNYNEMFKVPLITFTKPSKEKPITVSFDPIQEKSLKKPGETNKRKTEASKRMTKEVKNLKSSPKKEGKKYPIESTSSSSSIENPDIKIKRTAKDKNQNTAITKPLPLKNKVLRSKVENKTITESSSSSDEPQTKKSVRTTKYQSQIAVKAAKELAATLELPKRSSRVTRTQSQGLENIRTITTSLSLPEETQKKRLVRACRTQSQLITESEIEPNIVNKTMDKTKIKKTKAVSSPTNGASSTQRRLIITSEIEPNIVKKTMDKKKIKKTKAVSTPPSGIPKSESSSEERLRQKPMSAMTPEELVMSSMNTSVHSPRVTLARGKDRAREEMKMKIKEGLFDEDASNMEDVSLFRLQLNSEISRLTQLSDLWENIMEDSELPIFVQEQILSAVGLARLLMSSKMKQFEGLMTRCEERDASGGLITPADLQGFWDMVFIQIDEVDMRFKKLDQLKSSNWEEVKVVPQKQHSKQMKNFRPAKPKPTVQSKLKDIIAARRKANNQVDNCLEVESKTFEGGFFKVTSPITSPSILATPRNNSLLKNVLSTEAKKASVSKANTSMAMFRASLFGKNTSPGIEGIYPLPVTPTKTPVNLKATPGRSILKSAKRDLTTAKLSKTVLFNESDIDHDDDKENFYDANQHIQEADSGVSSMETGKDLPQTEIVQYKTKKTKLIRQDAFGADDTEISSYYSSNDATPVQRAAKIKAIQAIEARLKKKRTPKTPKTSLMPKTPKTPIMSKTPETPLMSKTPETPLMPKTLIMPKTPRLVLDDVDVNSPRRSSRISMQVIN